MGIVVVTLKRERQTGIVREEGGMMKYCVNFTQYFITWYTVFTHAHAYTVNPFGKVA